MARLSDIEDTIPAHILVTGLPGTGKTELVGRLAEKYNLIWLDLEMGGDTLKKFPTSWKERINYIKIKDSASYPVASETLLQLLKSGVGSICIEHTKFNCLLCKKDSRPVEQLDFNNLPKDTVVVIDTLTQLSHSILAHITKSQPVDYKPERDDWGALRRHTEYILSQLQAASYNIVCIAHITEAKLEDGRTKLVPNFGSASMSAEVAKAFSHVVYCDIKNGKHIAGSASNYSSSVVTKSRTDFRIEDMEIPSLLPLFDPVGHERSSSNVKKKELAGGSSSSSSSSKEESSGSSNSSSGSKQSPAHNALNNLKNK